MRFLLYSMGDDSIPAPPPSPAMMTEMGQFIGVAAAAGVIVESGAFAPSATGTHVSLSNGDFSVSDGPFAEAKELIGGWALVEVKDRDEALHWSKRFLAVLGEGESRIRQIYGPNDMPPGLDPAGN